MPKNNTPSKRDINPKDFIKQLKDLELKAVSGVESSFGKKNVGPVISDEANLSHKSSAGGPFGTMPRTAIEAYQRDKLLQEKYPEFKQFVGEHNIQKEELPQSHSQITQLLSDNPQLAYDVARSDLDNRKSRIPNDYSRAIASISEGVRGAKNMAPEEIKNLDYSKKFNMYDKMVRDDARKDMSTLRSEPTDQSLDPDNLRLVRKLLAIPE